MNYIIPEGLRWLQYFAFSFYTQNALFLNEFEGITLQDGKTSDEVLKAFGYGQISKDASVGYLAIYGAICQILGIVVFHFSCAYHNRKYNKIT